MVYITIAGVIVSMAVSFITLGVSFGKMSQQAKHNAEKVKEQDKHIGECANRTDVDRLVARIDHEVERREEMNRTLSQHGEILASLKSTLTELNKNIERLSQKIDNMKV
jgi:peptidoglycan hydrolase CwlO-like protein